MGVVQGCERDRLVVDGGENTVGVAQRHQDRKPTLVTHQRLGEAILTVQQVPNVDVESCELSSSPWLAKSCRASSAAPSARS